MTIGYWWFVTHVLLPPESRVTVGQQANQWRPPTAQATNASQADTTDAAFAREAPPADAKPSSWVTRDDHLAGLRGTFGDMFGAANALFSALAFACVFYALLLQREDLRLQQEQLTKTQRVGINAAKLQGHATLAAATLETIRQTGPQDPALRESLRLQLKQIQTLLDELETMEKA